MQALRIITRKNMYFWGMDFIHTLFKQYQSYPTYMIVLEMTATLFGLLSVFYSIKKNIWVYPTGIISTTIYIYLMFSFGLLGDTLINLYYTVMSIYGWILWAKHSDDSVHVEVTAAPAKEWGRGAILFAGSLLFVGTIYYFKPFIDNHFRMEGIELGFYHLDWANYTDIITTSMFLVGMYFMAKRYLENWILWIIADMVCIPMMLYKGLAVTSIQYLVFTIMAFVGYYSWKRDLR